MQSNYEKARTPIERIFVVSESLIALAQLVTTEESANIALDEVARDGLANLFAMLADKLNECVDQMETEKGARQ